MSGRQPHAVLMDRIRLEIQRVNPNARVWPRVTGAFRPMTGQGVIRVGIEGACDLHGYIPANGRPAIPFELEVKWAGDALRPRQEVWSDLMWKLGVPVKTITAKTEDAIPAAAAEAAEWVRALGAAHGNH